MESKLWPDIGDKIVFTGVKPFWFTNIIQDAKDLLEIDKEYTISKIELASSWCGVVLKEFSEKTFSLHFFKYEKKLTTEEVTKGKYVHTTLKELKDRKQDIDMSYTKEISPETAEKIRNQFRNARIKSCNKQ